MSNKSATLEQVSAYLVTRRKASESRLKNDEELFSGKDCKYSLHHKDAVRHMNESNIARWSRWIAAVNEAIDKPLSRDDEPHDAQDATT